MHATPSLRIIRRDPSVDGPAAGRRIVLVHGSMDRATSFIRLMARLRDWSVIAYDRRGYAGSAAIGPPLCFEDQVADLVEVLDPEPAVAFGHSYGGTVVLAAAAAHPELLPAAVVWEPPQPWLPWWPRVKDATDAGAEERAEWFMRRMVGDRIWERLPATTRAQRRAEGHTLHAELTSLDSGPAFRRRRGHRTGDRGARRSVLGLSATSGPPAGRRTTVRGVGGHRRRRPRRPSDPPGAGGRPLAPGGRPGLTARRGQTGSCAGRTGAHQPTWFILRHDATMVE